jgi:hypothetical protein
MAGGAEVDDAQARMTEDANAVRRRPKASIIRPSVADAGDHRVHRLPARMGPPVQFAGYAAHRFATKILLPSKVSKFFSAQIPYASGTPVRRRYPYGDGRHHDPERKFH